jgi:hypothetical protein
MKIPWRKIVAIMLLIGSTARAEVVINEVLSNEPGSQTSLEWFELYNASSASVNLSLYSFNTGGAGITLNGSLPAHAYLVVCRDSARFKQEWTVTCPLLQRSFALTNDSGTITLLRVAEPVSVFTWNQSGEDGTSWERVEPDSAEIRASLDPSGSTPGRLNSHTRVSHDLAVDSVEASVADGLTIMTFRVVNRGLMATSQETLSLYHSDTTAPDSLGTLADSAVIGALVSGSSVQVTIEREFAGDVYVALAAKVADDDRNSNNRIDFVAPGASYPPLILSECLPNPSGALSSEWVELKNVSAETIDLRGWLLGDSSRLVSVTGASVLVPPDSYVVIVQDEPAFRSYYEEFGGIVRQSAEWPTLNNDGDRVRLVDSFALEADRFAYNAVFDDNHTWSRGETVERHDDWGKSEDVGGTPGQRNRVRFSSEGENDLILTITPQIISPDGDGIDDSALIAIQAPEASAYTLKLYDSEGRLVRSFEDDSPDLSEKYVWRGDNSGGERQPIGIYIVYFEASGVESIKKTVVVAR